MRNYDKMKNKIAFVVSLVLIMSVFASCGNKVETPDLDDGLVGPSPIDAGAGADDTITGNLIEVDTLDEDLGEEELDSSLGEMEKTLEDW
jgi:hypothetical protein